MSRTGPAESSTTTDGFTLLEVVCALVIIALMAALALPSPPQTTSRTGIERLAMDAAGIMKADRYAAARRREDVTTMIDVGAREIRSGASRRVLAVPADVAVKALLSGSCHQELSIVGLTFYPDGRACGGAVTFARASDRFEVRVNWLTGGVEIVAATSS